MTRRTLRAATKRRLSSILEKRSARAISSADRLSPTGPTMLSRPIRQTWMRESIVPKLAESDR